MSYSRWSNGNWYVFWMASNATHKHQESLACWHAASWNHPYLSYLTVKEFLKNPNWNIWDEDESHRECYENVLSGFDKHEDSVFEKISLPNWTPAKMDFSVRDKMEILEYMQEWINDVDKEWSDK